MLLYPQGYEVTGCPCELPLWFAFVFENASSLFHRHFLWDLGLHLVLYASMLGPPAGLSMVRMRQPSSARHLLALNLTQDLFLFFLGSFLRHLARSSLFPAMLGRRTARVRNGCTLYHYVSPLRDAFQASRRTHHSPASRASCCHGQPGAVLPFSVLLASSTVSRTSHSSSVLTATAAQLSSANLSFPLSWAALHHW